MALFSDVEYEGNVRELRSIVEYAYLMARAGGAEEIGRDDLNLDLSALRYQRHGNREANRSAVERTLAITKGNVKLAAERLGVSRNTIHSFRRGTHEE